MLPVAVRGSVFWKRSDTSFTSGFVDDVMFAHNGQALATRKGYVFKLTH